MAAKKEDDQPATQNLSERQHLSARISKHVLHALGVPGHLHRVQVRALWENRFRVNVFVGEDAVSARVAHSFFLVADNDGNIIASNPKITPQYSLKDEQANKP